MIYRVDIHLDFGLYFLPLKRLTWPAWNFIWLSKEFKTGFFQTKTLLFRKTIPGHSSKLIWKQNIRSVTWGSSFKLWNYTKSYSATEAWRRRAGKGENPLFKRKRPAKKHCNRELFSGNGFLAYWNSFSRFAATHTSDQICANSSIHRMPLSIKLSLSYRNYPPLESRLCPSVNCRRLTLEAEHEPMELFRVLIERSEIKVDDKVSEVSMVFYLCVVSVHSGRLRTWASLDSAEV